SDRVLVDLHTKVAVVFDRSPVAHAVPGLKLERHVPEIDGELPDNPGVLLLALVRRPALSRPRLLVFAIVNRRGHIRAEDRGAHGGADGVVDGADFILAAVVEQARLDASPVEAPDLGLDEVVGVLQVPEQIMLSVSHQLAEARAGLDAKDRRRQAEGIGALTLIEPIPLLVLDQLALEPVKAVEEEVLAAVEIRGVGRSIVRVYLAVLGARGDDAHRQRCTELHRVSGVATWIHLGCVKRRVVERLEYTLGLDTEDLLILVVIKVRIVRRRSPRDFTHTRERQVKRLAHPVARVGAVEVLHSTSTADKAVQVGAVVHTPD